MTQVLLFGQHSLRDTLPTAGMATLCMTSSSRAAFTGTPVRLSSARRVPRAAAYRLVISMESTWKCKVSKKEELLEAKQQVRDLIQSKHCNPIIVRLAWHDSGSYDKSIKDFPNRGGANGSVRFYPEIEHKANAGLEVAVKLLTEIADKHDGVSYADLFQMASAEAIELAGGPHIPLRFGRRDSDGPESKQAEGNLPAAAAPFPNGERKPADHLRNVFYRMGLTDKDIVALSGAHTLGRVKPSRSGFGSEKTKYTENGPGTPGGTSWTIEWLKFDNSYFKEIKEQRDADLIVLPTDAALFEDEGFRPHAEKYAADQDAFFADYVESHLKLSELGVEWVGGEPICLN